MTIIIVLKQELSAITNIWQTVGHIWTPSLTLPFPLKRPLRGNVLLLGEVSRQSHRESNWSWPLRKVQIASSCHDGLCLQSGWWALLWNCLEEARNVSTCHMVPPASTLRPPYNKTAYSFLHPFFSMVRKLPGDLTLNGGSLLQFNVLQDIN